MARRNQGVESSEAGFTIVEMLIAISLLLVAMIPLAGVLSFCLQNSVNTKKHEYAKQIAASEIDQAKSFKFDAIGVTGATGLFATGHDGDQLGADSGIGFAPTSSATSSEGDVFTVTRDVRLVVKNMPNESRTKRLIVIVSWTSPQGNAERIVVTSESGPSDVAA